MLVYKLNNRRIKNRIYIPKYYDPALHAEILALSNTHELLCLGDLIDEGFISVQTGHEIGKMAYGTGNIPFVRTSDITNWEIKTIPKQGVSNEVYQQYAKKEDVQVGDILFVRDGTYLIGTTCMVTQLDIPMIYQSHILKFRVNDKQYIDPYLLFICLNCSLVQRQIRNIQFTADIIDTVGNRYRELVLPIPLDPQIRAEIHSRVEEAINTRIKFKAAVKQMPLLLERVLESNSDKPFDNFFAQSTDELLDEIVQDTTTLEFGEFSAYTINISKIKNRIYLPKYYDPSINKMLNTLSQTCTICSVQELLSNKVIELSTGDEIGKMAYGTGNIPFVRTSDFSNWEIKADTKQGVSEDIYRQYAEKEDVRAKDILLVRDGTYLVGTSCMITELDTKMLYCGGLIKIRVKDEKTINPYLLLGLLNSYIVKRQMRTKQFTRDVIDTLGQRFREILIPIPRSPDLRRSITVRMQEIVHNRITARNEMRELSGKIICD